MIQKRNVVFGQDAQFLKSSPSNDGLHKTPSTYIIPSREVLKAEAQKSHYTLGNKPSEFIAKEAARINYEQQLELMYSKRPDTLKLAKFLKSKGRASHLNKDSPKIFKEKTRNKVN